MENNCLAKYLFYKNGWFDISTHNKHNMNELKPLSGSFKFKWLRLRWGFHFICILNIPSIQNIILNWDKELGKQEGSNGTIRTANLFEMQNLKKKKLKF